MPNLINFLRAIQLIDVMMVSWYVGNVTLTPGGGIGIVCNLTLMVSNGWPEKTAATPPTPPAVKFFNKSADILGGKVEESLYSKQSDTSLRAYCNF